ncbi:hypothetical protein NMY22_g4808 [Coprinellus aureogranulatus]|nr:hypothetical protein NMY22_g4808 [Coprinellus aureogranulatus]
MEQHHSDVCTIAQKNWRAIQTVDSHVANLEQEILIKGEQIKDLREENDHLWRTIEALGRQLRALQERMDMSDSERYNYQRLETLGDAVLKYVVGVQLYAEFPMWHEGYLTRAKDHAVSNVKLAKECFGRGVFRWILREVMMGKKWLPRYVSGTKKAEKDLNASEGLSEGGVEAIDEAQGTSLAVQPAGGVSPAIEETATKEKAADAKTAKKGKKKGKGKNKGKSQELSTKVLADVVEALIGAAYEHGGFDLGYECIKFFDLGVKWQPLSSRLTHILANIRPDTDLGVPIPPQIADVETMIGYTFQHKILLIEALTHSSYREHISTISYERLEFLGDSILDMVATDYLYHAPGKEYSPGHMHIRKSAVVNGHFLAYICLGLKHISRSMMPQPVADEDGELPSNPYVGRMEFTPGVDEQEIYLWQCLLHSNQQVLDDQTNTFTRYEIWKDVIRHALEHEEVFPWAALTRLQAPKFFSDIVEAIIGAVYLDSGGNMDTIKQFLRGIGILPILERIVNDGVDVFHPVSRVAMWASRHDKTVRYAFEHSKGDISCILLVDEEEEVRETEKFRGKSSQEEVKFAVAEKAIKQFKLRDVGAKSMIGDKKEKVKSRPKRKRVSE